MYDFLLPGVHHWNTRSPGVRRWGFLRQCLSETVGIRGYLYPNQQEDIHKPENIQHIYIYLQTDLLSLFRIFVYPGSAFMINHVVLTRENESSSG